MNSTYINSSFLVGEVIQDFNIKSYDFVNRAPAWIVGGLESLRILSATTEQTVSGKFWNNRFELPKYCHQVISVTINHEPASLENPGGCNKSKSTSYCNNKIAVITPVSEDFNSTIHQVPQRYTTRKNQCNNKNYKIQGNWVITDIEEGYYEILYLSLPIEYDSDVDQVFPLIPNVGMVKEYLKWFILEKLLQRGYIHPIYNLRDNSYVTNVNLRLQRIRPEARASANAYNAERRSNLADILTNINYGN